MIQKDKTQLQRHIFIDRMIRDGMQSGQYSNCNSIAKEYEVSSKTIMRDIDYLKNQCDAPIEYDARKKGYYYSEANYKMPAVSINASDLFAICLADKVLAQHHDTPIYGKLKSVFKKIEESLPEKISIHPAWVDNRISIIQPQQTSIIPEIWEMVADALQQGRTLAISYLKPSSEKSKNRRLDPYHLMNFQGEWYLIAFCHKRQKVQTFAVSRIKEAKMLADGFKVPDDFDFEKINNRFGVFSGKSNFQVKILFSKKLAPYIAEREWHPSQKITRKKNGKLQLEITTSHLFDIKQWILSWGSGAKVLAPAALIAEVKDELQVALGRYNDAE